ncbi:MAG: OmpA family protein [Phycisphaerales bacterium]|nr:OmpA family protein [Phycisphaerales bacterium]NNM27752.1 OmpA family protein [Phycisphaerales bacterium]
MAVKKKQKKSGPGVPEWVVTFGDMMSLLLCFFILLQMFSEVKKDQEYQRVVTAIKEAFGYAGLIGVMPVPDPPLKSLVEVLETMAVENNNEETVVSQTREQGVDGDQMRVTKIREGIVFTIGGPSTFDTLSAEVKEPVRAQLAKLAQLLKGRNNKVEIVGHAAAKYLPPDAPWTSLDQLSFQRAENVKQILLEMGIEDRVFRLKAVGMREPIRSRAVEPEDAAENRRVEVILTEVLVDEVNTDALYTNETAARGG